MGVDAALDITAEERQTVLALLQRHLPGTAAWVYGSRVKWTSRPPSDLDLVVFATPDQRRQVGDLREAFEESALPFRVDLFVWDDVPDSFRTRIEAEHVVLARTTERSRHVGWIETKLGEVITLKRGYNLPKRDRHQGPVPVVSSSGIADHHSISKVAGPGVVTGRDGTLGQVFFVPNDFWPLNTALYVRDFKGNDPRFISYFLRSLDCSNYSDKAAVPGLNRNHVHEEAVRIPASVVEQRAIAHILGTLDDKIELNRRMNATLEAIARALFRSWFVDFEPVRAKMEGRDTGLPKEVADLFPDRLVNSELGEIPEGWQLKPLDAVARFRNGLALQNFRPSPNAARLPVVKIAQLRSGEANNGEWASATITPECIIENGDVVFSWSGSLLVRTWCGGRAALNQHLFKVTSDRYPKWYYLYSILSHFPELERIAADKARTMGHIRRHHLADALCIVPPDRVIARVTGMLGRLVERQVANDVASRTLTALRDALLPRLVSGELRVGDAARLVGAIA